MVQLIVGKKGKGKTKQLLDKVNAEVKTANGNIVYIDKSTKHMFELNNKVRLISATDYPLKNSDEFIGFICGIVSQDHDLRKRLSRQLPESSKTGRRGHHRLC